MGTEIAMMRNRSTSRIGIPQCAADADRTGKFLKTRRAIQRNIQRMKHFGSQKRTAKIEGKTRQRPMETNLQAAQFEEINLRGIHARNSGHGGTISTPRKSTECRGAAIGSFAEGKSKIQHRISKLFLKKAFGGDKFVL